MRWFIALCAMGVYAQSFDVRPQTIRQGEVLKVRAGETVKSVRMSGRTITLFPQTEGGSLGLMPVPVLTKPGQYKLEFLDANQAVLRNVTVTVQDARYPKQNITISKTLSELKPSPGEVETFRAFRKEVLPERYWSEPMQLPVPGCLTSLFGVRRFHNGKATGDFHGGLDQRGAAGTPIHAVTGGVVKIAQQFNLRGGTVAINHGQGLQSVYLHMSQVAAKEGSRVQPGDVIGYVGTTGRSTAPHLHWSLYVYGETVNPRQWMKVTPPCAVPPKKPERKRK